MSNLIYNKTNWKDDESTPINSRNLNNLENGVEYIYRKWDDIISDSTTGDNAAELIDARNAPGQNNKTLGQRLNGIDSQINKNTNEFIEQINIINENNNDFVLYSFFRNNTDNNIDFYISNDGYNLKRINSKLTIQGRDPSIVYKNGYWMIAITSYNPHDFEVYKSKDFVNWELKKVSVGLYNATNNKVWAPEWFEDDNGDLYILISLKIGEENDKDGNLIPNFRPYIVKCLDVENLLFDTPRELNLENSNKIDHCMIKKEGTYNLFIKDEYDKCIEHWTSSNLISWIKKSNKIESLGENVEGVTVVKIKDTYYLYADSYKDDKGIIYYTTSNDLTTWSEKKALNVGTNRVRHGSSISITHNKAKQDIQKYQSSNNYFDSNNVRNLPIPLSNYANSSNEIYNLEIINKAVYVISSNENFTIKSFLNPNNAKEFYFYISSNTIGSLSIDTDSTIVSVPSGYTYDAKYGDNDVFIKFIYCETIGKFKPVVMSNSFSAKKIQPSKRGGWKRIILTSQTIDTLDAEDGVVYQVNGGNDVVINGVTSGKESGTHFYLLLASGSTGSITINSGNNLTVQNGVYTISVANNNNDILIEFIKIDSANFRLVK